MSNIYSQSFFHYTTKKGLLGILKDGFGASYCKEQFKNSAGNLRYIGIPMISFCDIPLSLLPKIVYAQRGYAIGMKREWGLRKCLIPVFYFSNEDNSALTNSIKKSCSDFYANGINSNELPYKILGISKPYEKYEDKDYIKGRNKENYIEREWRKIYFTEGWKTLEQYEKLRGDKKQKPKPMLADKLEFTIDDIEFIIVKRDKDIDSMIKSILKNDMKICQNELNDIDKQRLIAKIITEKQIKENF